MNLTEACKLAKNIEGFKCALSNLLANRDYTTTVKETHFRSKAVEGETDEEITREVDKTVDITVEEILTLLDILMVKKAQLSSAIEDAKHNIKIDVNGMELAYDSAVEYNKSLRNTAIYQLSRTNRLKPSTVKGSDYGHKFDVEGKQTRYIYEKEVVTELTFDIAETKKKEKEYRKIADKVSNAIDEAKLTTKIDIDLGIDVNDTLEDVIEAFVSREEVTE
jgi:hypothetical protein